MVPRLLIKGLVSRLPDFVPLLVEVPISIDELAQYTSVRGATVSGRDKIRTLLTKDIT